MRPVLFEIFGLPIHSYGLMLAIAFIVGIFGLHKLVREKALDGITFDTIIDLGVWILIGAIVGARLAYVISEYQEFVNAPLDIFKISSGGLAFHGGLIGGFLAGYWFTKVKKISPWKLADLAAPWIAFGYSIVRVGCFLNGCCYGKVTLVPWALPAHDHLFRHPTQIYSMIGSLLLFFILYRLRNHKHYPGFLFLLYIGLYSILRFGVEFFREGAKLDIYPLFSWAQVVCLVMGMLAFGVMGWQSHRYNKGRLEMDAASEIRR